MFQPLVANISPIIEAQLKYVRSVDKQLWIKKKKLKNRLRKKLPWRRISSYSNTRVLASTDNRHCHDQSKTTFAHHLQKRTPVSIQYLYQKYEIL